VSYRIVRGGSPAVVLGTLLPPDVIAVEAIGAVEPDLVYDIETAAIARAVDSRKLEFERGRSCARRALAELGVAPTAIPADSSRAPIWPVGVIGTISHCRDYCVAAVARSSTRSSIGIDAEVLQPIAANVERMILRDDERRQLQQLAPTAPWACVVFSAKEAVYKAWHPLARCWLDFHAVEIRLDPTSGRFEAVTQPDVTVPSAWPRTLEGRFAIDGERVVTTVCI
jgi:4'-phosphopantetheinyl transferase EntD